MTVKEFNQGDIIYAQGQTLDCVYLVMKGCVEAACPGGSYILRGGDIVGLCGLNRKEVLIEYKAAEKCSLIAYPYEANNLKMLLETYADSMKYFLVSFFRQLNDVLGGLKKLESGIDEQEILQMYSKNQVPKWLSGYYAALEQMLAAWDCNKTGLDFICGFLLRAAEDLRSIVALSGELQAYREENMQNAAQEEKQEITLEEMDIPASVSTQDEEAIRQQLEELSGSLDQILAYADCEEELSDAFRRTLLLYRKVPDKNSADDTTRMLRKNLTDDFYKIYAAAFLKSMEQEEVPVLLKMFFNFGYVDEELAGIPNALYLYQIAKQMPTAPGRGIYSFYEWLTAIYRGEKEPGRNEFDLDYVDSLREMKRTGKINAKEEAELLQSRSARVMFELENVFPQVNKVTYGRISSFCPVFSEHDILKPLESALVAGYKVAEIFEVIRKVDYSAYYRQAVYSDQAAGIAKEYVDVEVLPDIILMPNIGNRGVMWQEIEGKRRTTPARMMCSIFLIEDLNMTIIRLTGEFRWEMCKRVQGGRWNDISEPSLTSEYCDYAQFYKKNPELSAAVKEKIKNEITRARNSFKELFVRDYIQWVLYESSGSPRLNKISRSILFKYCPFSKELRDKLGANPMYKELLERYETQMSQKRHRLDNLCQKMKAQGKAVPEQIEQQRQFLEM